MNLLDKISNFLKPKALDISENIDLNNVVGWRSVGGSGTYGYYQSNQYENGYSSISTLANGFLMIEPYTIDKSGKAVASNVLNRLYTPNKQMSATDFREALAVMTLVHDKVRIRVHHSGTRINANSITGFTFMENYSDTVVDGKRKYKLQNGESLTDDEVITLKSINPNDLNGGFSPSRAAKRWTDIDDYIADYQKGFFKNGAVPSGQFIITARSGTEFNDIVDKLQSQHRGAGANNNVTYSYRPVDAQGKQQDSQLEWVPFSTQNKDMALKDLFDNANKKIDSVYGVPASMRGVNDTNTYASMRVDEVVLVKYALSPMTLKIWSKFTHELNRITGGLGVAITYDLEVPQIADEEKVKAEARKVDADTVAELVAQGFTLDSAVEYVKEGDLDSLIQTQKEDDEKPEVLDSTEASGTPDQPIDGYSKIISHIEKLMETKEAPKVKQIDVVDKELYIQKLSRVVKDQMKRQVEKAINDFNKTKAIGDTSSQEDKVFTKEMLALLLPLMEIYGNKTVNTGINLVLNAGLSTENIEKFKFTPDQTAEDIRNILNKGILEGTPKGQIEDQLRSVILGSENEYRVARLSRTEVNLSEGKASVSAMENIQRQTGYKIYKVWNISSSDPCPYCLSLAGKETLVDENFVDLDQHVHGVDGTTYVNNFKAADSGNLHPNCNCYTTYKVERN